MTEVLVLCRLLLFSLLVCAPARARRGMVGTAHYAEEFKRPQLAAHGGRVGKQPGGAPPPAAAFKVRARALM